jgi:hypothetical protein
MWTPMICFGFWRIQRLVPSTFDLLVVEYLKGKFLEVLPKGVVALVKYLLQN